MGGRDGEVGVWLFTGVSLVFCFLYVLQDLRTQSGGSYRFI